MPLACFKDISRKLSSKYAKTKKLPSKKKVDEKTSPGLPFFIESNAELLLCLVIKLKSVQ